MYASESVCYLLCILTMVRVILAYPSQIPVGAMFNVQDKQLKIIDGFELAVKHRSFQREMFAMTAEQVTVNQTDAWTVSSTMCNELQKGFFAFFYSGTTTSYPMLSAMCTHMHLPAINFRLPYFQNNLARTNPYQFSMHPPVYKAVVDMIAMKRWKDIVYMYDKNEGILRFQQIIHLLRLKYNWNIGFETWPLDVKNIGEGLSQFHQQNRWGVQRVVLDLTNTLDVRVAVTHLKNISRTMLLSNALSVHYLISSLEFSADDLMQFKDGSFNITTFSLINDQSQRKMLNSKLYRAFNSSIKNFTPESACAFDAFNMVAQALAHMQAKNQTIIDQYFHHGEIYTNGKRGIYCMESGIEPHHGMALATAISETKFEGLSGQIQFDEQGLRTNVSMEVYEISFKRLKSDSSVSSTEVNQWNDIIGIITSQSKLSYERQHVPTPEPKAKLRVVTVLKKPFVSIKENCNGTECYEGFCIDLLAKISEQIDNFQYEIYLSAGNIYGAPDLNNLSKWNGMIGDLRAGKADLAIGDLTITKARQKAVDFSQPFMTLGLSIMIQKLNESELHVFSFMSPLSTEIWMYIIFAYLGVSVVIFLVSRFSPYEWRVEESHNGSFTISNDFSVYNCMWFTIAAFLQQGTEILPRSISGRIAGSAWWFFSMIIVSSYTANLAAFLTLEKMQTPIERADDLVKQTKIKYGIQRSGSTAEFFRESQVETYKRMWLFMNAQVPTVFTEDYAEGIKRVRDSKGKYAFILESSYNDYINTQLPCDTQRVGPLLNSVGYGIATPFGSELKDKINLAILELQDKSELKNLENFWWWNKGECNPTKQEEAKSALNMPKVAGIFYILIGGSLIAMLVSVCEFLYRTRLEARKTQKPLSSSIRSQLQLSLRGDRIRGECGGREAALDVSDSVPKWLLDKNHGEKFSFT